jgi:Flp pilus assembly protein TadG
MKMARSRPAGGHRGQRGQILVIFVGGIVVLLGFCAIVVDVSWYWANSLRVQRAADAAALAGVISLPADVGAGEATAAVAAGQNGYALTSGCKADGVSPAAVPGMCAYPDQANDRQLDVTISEPVNTFFMRVLGINTIIATRTAKAVYVLPVPMGSPQSWYGVGCLKTPSGVQPVCTTGDSNGLSGIPDATLATPSPPSGRSAPSQIPSQGFFGAAITRGGDASNGDAYDPGGDTARGASNPSYNPAGVYYQVVIPAGDGNGSVHVFDPGFCSVDSGDKAPGDSKGNWGVGDHWISGTQNPVSTYYNLWNTHGNPFATSQFSLVAQSGAQFEANTGGDPALDYTGSTGPCPTSGAHDPFHDAWWTLASGLPTGTYYLQVTTTKVDTSKNGGQDVLDAGVNAKVNAENMYSLEVTAAGVATPQVYGAGSMVAYNNVIGGDQRFYLAQIPRQDAGKTLEIDLFDVGDVSGAASLDVEDPDGNVYTNPTFSYTADGQCDNSIAGNCEGAGVKSITATLANGDHPFNDSWLTILIPLPPTYGSAGLTPPGESEAGWWKIDYRIAAGVQSSDTTTWRVSVRGNPVHLIVP